MDRPLGQRQDDALIGTVIGVVVVVVIVLFQSIGGGGGPSAPSGADRYHQHQEDVIRDAQYQHAISERAGR